MRISTNVGRDCQRRRLPAQFGQPE